MTLAGAANAASTTIDDAYVLQGWRTASTGTPQLSFTSRFGAPDGGGVGALALTTGTGDSITFTTSGDGRPLSDFYRTTGAYYGYRSSASTALPGRFPQFIIDVDLAGPGDPADQVRLYYDPAAQRDASGATVVDLGADRWTRFDYARGAVCAETAVPGVVAADQTDCRNGGAKSLRDILEVHPQASVTEFGFLQKSEGALAAAVDKLNVGEDAYNFEPTTAITTPSPTPTPTRGADETGGLSPTTSPQGSGSKQPGCTCS